MRVKIGGIEASTKRYISFSELTDEFVDHETAHGRRAPDYDLGVVLPLIGIYFLKKVADKVIDVLVDEALDKRRMASEEEKVRVQVDLEEKRHSELAAEIEELRKIMQQAVETQPPQSAMSEDAASVSALLQWAKRDNIKIIVTLETEAEGDLEEAFETLIKNVPGSSVSNEPRQLEGGDDST